MLRPYQKKIIEQTYAAWQKYRHVLLEMPTGAGKTYTFCNIIRNLSVPTMAIAHRQELVSQMSLTLSKMSIPHRIIGSEAMVSQIVRAQQIECGKIWYDSTAPTVCASVDTLIRRNDPKLFSRIEFTVMDEAHHVLRENKWGRAFASFPNARTLGVTATPTRADGKGLGAEYDGVFETLISGPSGRELIDDGYLSPFECIVAEVQDVDWSSVPLGADGDYKKKELATATKASATLTGCMVQEYRRHAEGLQALVFCVDIEHAQETAGKFQAAGLSVDVLTGKTDVITRVKMLDRFRSRKLKIIVNVDICGEGLDVPGVDVVIMGRRTNSFVVYSQQFGRALRPVYAPGATLDNAESRRGAIASGPKPAAKVIDHVGNVYRHLLPTARRNFTLERREKKNRPTVAPEDKIRICVNPECSRPYEAFRTACPHCGQEPVRQLRKYTIEELDGDLQSLDPDDLAKMYAMVEDLPATAKVPYGADRQLQAIIQGRHNKRLKALDELKDAIALWGGYKKSQGYTIRESQKLFYLTYGIDVLSAQVLTNVPAEDLKRRVLDDIAKMG